MTGHNWLGSTRRLAPVRAAALAAVIGGSLTLAACSSNLPKDMQPLSYATVSQLEKRGFSKEDPILVRIYKQESELEVWKKSSKDGKFRKFKTYDICKWSGQLGPKKQEGDRQAPEGFYTVSPAQMNPKSSYYLSFNIGYPNAYDRSLNRTGTHLMVHGACSSAGCYAMADEQIGEIYALAREAFDAGQTAFQVQAYPFRMTPENLALNADNENMSFWRMLKDGNDHFEVTGQQPRVGVCDRRYVFDATADNLDPNGPCPAIEVPEQIQVAVAEKQAKDKAEETVILAKLERKKQADEQAVMIASAQPATPTATAPVAFSSGGASGRLGILGRLNPFGGAPAPQDLTPAAPAATGTVQPDGTLPLPPERPEVASNAEEAIALAVVKKRWSPPLPMLGYLPTRLR
ncbi:MAG: transcriptional regulator [Rhodobiaceae bacterium]|nr:transcriptional regulator [Rhodobiaceae bacterium]